MDGRYIIYYYISLHIYIHRNMFEFLFDPMNLNERHVFFDKMNHQMIEDLGFIPEMRIYSCLEVWMLPKYM